MIYVAFYKASEWRGYMRVFWYIVSLFSKRYVHVDFKISDNRIVVADSDDGVSIQDASKWKHATKKIAVAIPETIFLQVFNKYDSMKYGWKDFLSIPTGDSGKDHKGVICSEFVAKMLIDCIEIMLSTNQDMDEQIKADWLKLLQKLKDLPPHRASPRDVYDVLK